MFELTYDRKNIVRTVAIGFFLGAMVLSIGGFLIFSVLALIDPQPGAIRDTLVYFVQTVVVTLFAGVLIGIVTRIGLGLHAYWSYKNRKPELMISQSGSSELSVREQ